MVDIMKSVVQQKYPRFLPFLKNMLQETVAGNSMPFLTSGMEINIAPDEKDSFEYALHLMTQWRLNVPVTLYYLINIDKLVARLKMHYTAVTPNANNHALIECSAPKLGLLTTGETSVMICTYVADH